MKKYALLFVLCLLYICNSFGQQNAIDSLNVILANAKSDTSKVSLLNNLSRLYSKLDPVKGIENGQQAYQLARRLGFMAGQGQALTLIGQNHRVQGNFKQAAISLAQSLEIYKFLKDKENIAIAYNYIGLANEFQGNYSEAIENYTEAQTLFKELGNNLLLAQSYNDSGLASETQGLFEKALEYFLMALEIYEEIDEPRGVAKIYNNIGMVYEREKDLDQALDYYKRSLSIKEAEGDKPGLAIALHNIGIIQGKLDLPDSAMALYLKSVDIKKKIGDKSGLSATYNEIGRIYQKKGSYQKALEYNRWGYDIAKEINSERDLGYTSLGIGQVFIEMEQYDSAAFYLNRAKEIGLQLGNRSIQGDAYKSLYQLNKRQGKFEALFYLERLKALQDSILNNEQAQEIGRMQAKYDYQSEIAVLQMDAEIQSLKLQRQKNIRNAIIAVAILGFIFAWALFRRFRFRQKVKNEQKEKNRLIEEEKNKTAFEKQRVEHLQNIDKLKDQFLANTSHELRTPLNGIIGMAESMIDGAAGKPTPKMLTDLSLIIASGKRLATLVDSILDFSKLKAHDLTLSLKPLDLRSVVEVVVRLSKPLVSGKQIRLENQVPTDLLAVVADENRLQQILHNLVGNAIKFTESGSIAIGAKQDDETISVSVKDTGIGIPKDKIELIFQEFVQADASTTREFVGTGLGLSITKKLVELHGGIIKVESEVGGGTIFTFTLPVSAEIADPLMVMKGNLMDVTAQESTLLSTNGNGQDSIKVLIVDDEPINQKVLANHLAFDQYQLTAAHNGQEALDAIQRPGHFDLVLLDIMMPKMSGYEVCQKIREKFSPAELPVIMITAKDQVADLVEGLSYGANDYITKPFSKNEFLARVKTHLNLLKINSAYGRFVPQEFFKALGKESILDVQLGDQVQGEISVLFSDIRSYSTLSESMTPRQNFNFLNSYLKRVGPVIRDHNGFVNQYYGDGTMALFRHSVQDAVGAAIDIQKAIAEYNVHRQKKNRKPIKIGVGLHTGDLMLGVIGDDRRMDTGVVSDTVNTAARLEGLTKFYGASVVLSEQSLNKMDDPDRFNYRPLGKVQVKGKLNSMKIYEFYDGEDPAVIESKKRAQSDFEEGLNHYFSKRFTDAATAFKEVLQITPEDPAAELYLRRSAEFMVQGVAEGWTGIEAMTKK